MVFDDTESRKSRCRNLARFNLALKFNLARDLRDFRNPSCKMLLKFCRIPYSHFEVVVIEYSYTPLRIEKGTINGFDWSRSAQG